MAIIYADSYPPSLLTSLILPFLNLKILVVHYSLAEGEDYVPVTDSKLSLSSSTESVEVVLEVTDDMDYEGEPAESFGVRLSLLSGENAQRVTIQPSVVNIFIEDNEPKPGALKYEGVKQNFVLCSYLVILN